MFIAQSIALILFFGFVFAGCSFRNENGPDAESSTPTASEPLTGISTSPVPATTFESPLPTPKRGPDFFIDESVQVGDQVVRGEGPAKVAIAIVDVSLAGEVKGQGIIADDGTFSIETTPVMAGNTLGILITDLTGTGLSRDDFQNNENYRSIPLIGLLVDTHRVPLDQ